jgi:hypothetical protein
MGGAASTLYRYLPSNTLTVAEVSKNPIVHFLPVGSLEVQDTAKKILEAAEEEDGYYALIGASSFNRRARVGQDRVPLILTEGEQQAWKDSIRAAIQGSPKNLFVKNTVTRVLVLPDSAEAGFPHTRPDVICFPRNYASDQLAETFVHELVHIHQRHKGTEWLNFLRDSWSFTPVGSGSAKAGSVGATHCSGSAKSGSVGATHRSDQLPAGLVERERLNPDTLAVPHMAWKGRYVPMKVFLTGFERVSMGSVETIWYDLENRIDMRNAPEGWMETFGTQADHPFEMAAYYVGSRSAHSDIKASKEVCKWLDI